CSLDGKHKSYCTPEAYRGETCWLFHNRGDGTFEDVTASSGVFDSSSKSLGVAMLDYDRDGWPDLLVANDTQPNKLYRNAGNGTFKEVAVEAGIAITNFDNEMVGLYRMGSNGNYEDIAVRSGVGLPSRNTLGFGCTFCDLNLDGFQELVIAN